MCLSNVPTVVFKDVLVDGMWHPQKVLSNV